MYFFITLFLILLSILVYAVISIRSGIFIKSINESETGKMLLTFDDGPHEIYTPAVLDILNKYQIKAIFFCIGKNAERYPHLVKRISDEGHEIGNHTFHHNIKSTFKTWIRYKEEIDSTTNILESLSVKKIKYFRPPFGITNPSIAKAITRSGLKSMAWNIRTFDTIHKDAEKIVQKIERNLTNNSIILCHDTQEITPIYIELFLNNLANR